MISLLQESLSIVKVAVFLFVDLLLEFSGRGENYFFLGDIFLLGPR